MRSELSSASRSERDPRPPRVRSAVTNGRRLFVVGDGNSAWSRRYRDLIAGHISDLGGATVLSESQMSLVRRASAIECELEQMEGRLSRGGNVDLDGFTRAASHLRRILETLGLERRPREVQTLGEYLTAREAEETSSSALDGEGSAKLPAASEERASALPCGEGSPSP
jgi:hypothetical protein